MSNKGNFSQAMREILGIDSSHEKAKVNEEAVATPEHNEDQMAANENPEEPTNNDRLNQDFNQAFNQSSQNVKSTQSAQNTQNTQSAQNTQNTQSSQNAQNMGFQSNQSNNTYNKQQTNYSNDEPAFYDKPSYNQSNQNNFSGNFTNDSPKFNNNFGGDDSGNGTDNNEPYSNDEVGTTIITRNTIIEGNIKSFENIELNGKVKGKIDTTKNVGVSGFVQGDIEATDILLEGAQIKGSIASKGALLMDKDTLLVGDVEAQNTRVDGKIKGEVNVGGNGEFLSNSVVVGNITVSNFYVQYGARMQGYINTNFSKNEEDSIFGQITGN